MARRLFVFDQPDRFVAGTVGEPGARTFFLQAKQGGAIASVALEKIQVSALADRLGDLLGAIQDDVVASDAADVQADEAPLDEPLVELFRVGVMALAWDAASKRVVIEAQPEIELDDGTEEDEESTIGQSEPSELPDLMQVRIEPAQAHAFIRRAQRVVAAGRPSCPFCGQPLEPTGHFCVKSSGLLN
jgi:uncharacterized repeat protein (TIGR03847 family)